MIDVDQHMEFSGPSLPNQRLAGRAEGLTSVAVQPRSPKYLAGVVERSVAKAADETFESANELVEAAKPPDNTV